MSTKAVGKYLPISARKGRQVVDIIGSVRRSASRGQISCLLGPVDRTSGAGACQIRVRGIEIIIKGKPGKVQNNL